MTEQELFEEGMWVSGIKGSNQLIKTLKNSPTKTALFYALYQGPIKNK